MAEVTITINTENDAFYDDVGEELSRILKDLAKFIDGRGCGTVSLKVLGDKVLRDINGNIVGKVEVSQ